MSKTRVRPPRKPRGEDPAVTIANQDRQIKMLIERVEFLRKRELELMEERNKALDEIQSHRETGESLCYRIDQMEKAHTRTQGWQDCAREILELHRDTIIAPGA